MYYILFEQVTLRALWLQAGETYVWVDNMAVSNKDRSVNFYRALPYLRFANRNMYKSPWSSRLDLESLYTSFVRVDESGTLLTPKSRFSSSALL